MRSLILLLTLLLLPLLAGAQPACPPGLTCDNPCGAAGVGKRVDGKVEPREGVPGMHVDADGSWTTCQVAKPARKGCRVDRAVEWQRFDESVGCRAPATMERVRDGAAVTLYAQPPTGEYIVGRAVLLCQNRVLQMQSSTCNRVSACERGPGSRSMDDGKTWWYFTGLLYDGEGGVARSQDGRTRAVRCSGGRLDLL